MAATVELATARARMDILGQHVNTVVHKGALEETVELFVSAKMEQIVLPQMANARANPDTEEQPVPTCALPDIMALAANYATVRLLPRAVMCSRGSARVQLDLVVTGVTRNVEAVHIRICGDRTVPTSVHVSMERVTPRQARVPALQDTLELTAAIPVQEVYMGSTVPNPAIVATSRLVIMSPESATVWLAIQEQTVAHHVTHCTVEVDAISGASVQRVLVIALRVAAVAMMDIQETNVTSSVHPACMARTVVRNACVIPRQHVIT